MLSVYLPQKNSFFTIFCFTSFFLLFSCASRPKEKLHSLDTYSFIELSGEGRGRIELGEEKYLFSFEALAHKAKNWTLVMNFPLYGQERLYYQWHQTPWHIEGSFIEALKNILIESKSGIKPYELDEVLEGLGEILRQVLSLQNGHKEPCLTQGKCSGKIKWQVSPELRAKGKISHSQKKIHYEVSFSRLKNNKYELMSLLITGQKGFKRHHPLMKLHLYWRF